MANKLHFVTAKGAAELLGVSVATVRRWEREEKIVAQGKTIRGWRYYLFTDIVELFAKNAGQNAISFAHPDGEISHALNIAPQKHATMQQEYLHLATAIQESLQAEQYLAATNACQALLKILPHECANDE